jgi:hypothetical protein
MASLPNPVPDRQSGLGVGLLFEHELQAFNVCPKEKTVPAVAVHALTFQAFDRKACSGFPPVVSNVHVPIPATSA